MLVPDRIVDRLATGSHPSAAEGMCLLEAASWLAGEPFGDHPRCVDPAIGALGRALNDGLLHDQLGRLVPYAARIVGTADPAHAEVRGYLLSDWAVRVAAPSACDAADLTEWSAKLRALDPVVDGESAAKARALAASAAEAAWAASAASAASAARAAEAENQIEAVRASALDLLDRLIAAGS